MGSTPNRAIPYAEPTDTLATYPATDKAAAERLDALLFDTGWVAVSVAAGFAPHASNPPQVRRIGSQVITRGAFLNTGIAAVNTNYPVGTVPAGFWPLWALYWAGGPVQGAQGFALLVSAAGALQIRTGAVLSVNYFLGAGTWTTD